MTSKEALETLKDSYHTKRDTELLSVIEEDLKTAELINNKLHFLSLSYKNASKEDLLELFILYADAFKVIENHFDVKFVNHSNYKFFSLEIYKDNKRIGMDELLGNDEYTFSALCYLRWKLSNDK